MLEHARHLLSNELVSLAEHLPPLTVADDDVLHTKFGQEQWRDFSGESALVVRVTILSTQLEAELVSIDQRLQTT